MQGARTTRVAQLVREAISDALARGEVKDPRVRAAGLVTVTHVEVSGDLRHAKVYVVVHGGDAKEAAKGLGSAAGFLRRKVGELLRAKAIPELAFFPDEGYERGIRMERLLDEIGREGKGDPK
jgi:ribosome-binding factor A